MDGLLRQIQKRQNLRDSREGWCESEIITVAQARFREDVFCCGGHVSGAGLQHFRAG